MTKSPRRSYIDLAEAMRTLDVSPEDKRALAESAVVRLSGYQGFHPERFIEHATSEDPQGKWSYNRRTGEGPQGLDEQIDLADFDENDDPQD